jgi:ATP/maltotriose-dependent transcriptional regulator MalT
MATRVLSRAEEFLAVAEFLDAASVDPTALVIEGDPGIGKTTVWSACVDLAVERGFRVLSARAAAAESVLGYSALADILAEVDPDAWAVLPTPQRHAVDHVLLRADAAGSATDPRAVAAGFLSVVKGLAKCGPVLVAIDDLQWLDSSTMQIIAFAARRLSGRVGVIGTVRTDPGAGAVTSWLQMPKHGQIRRITLGPLRLGSLREMVSERLGRSLPRHTMVRIQGISQGNPFYALELARVMDDQATGSEVRLPDTLADLVQTRVGILRTEVQDALLAASCVAAPTVELVARATAADPEHTVGLLEDAEDKGIVEIDGHRLRFTHPLLARGVYAAASPARRRAMHRSLAEIVEEPELQARHLAKAVAWGDPRTLECLDRAADIAHMRGAPAAAAELLDLAIGLGGDTAERRIRLAGHHFDAGDSARARDLLEGTIAALEPGSLRAQALSLLGPVRIFGDSFLEGVAAMESSLDEVPDDLTLRVPTSVALLLPLFNSGQLDDAWHRAQDAVTDAERLGHPLLLSQALSMRVFLGFLRGDGIDEPSLRSALEMEERYSVTASRSGFQMIVRPRSHHALLLGWTGQLDRAHEEMASLRQSCIEHGLEHELIYVTYYMVQVEIWRGNFTEAVVLTEQGMESALQLGGEVSIGAALTWRAALAAYAGNEQQVRSDVGAALAAMQRCGARMLEGWPIAIAGFLEVSLGNHQAALDTLEPLLSNLKTALDGTEIYLAEFVPDAVEALVHLGRLDEAEPLVEALERNGRRLDRAWMLAVGARCRSLLQAAQGDLDAAGLSAEAAMVEHKRLRMPFEKARTQLLLGQLQRRLNHRDSATQTLREALRAFECLGTPLWANRARAELARADVASRVQTNVLTPSEQQVAELAATGMRNRDVAEALFISPKTVEANLARIYRKLGIHSRAELGRHMSHSEP